MCVVSLSVLWKVFSLLENVFCSRYGDIKYCFKVMVLNGINFEDLGVEKF